MAWSVCVFFLPLFASLPSLLTAVLGYSSEDAMVDRSFSFSEFLL